MAKNVFKKRYVLGEGFPWALGIKNYKTLGMAMSNKGINYIELNWPIELWWHDCPKFRLVLERISDGKKA